MGKPYPAAGKAGHDLKALWDAAGLLREEQGGFRKAFIEYWSTDLRYSALVSSAHAPEDLLKGAQELSSYVTKRTNSIRGIVRRRAGR